MTLDPLRDASTVVQIHVALAFGAIVLTLAILSLRKGSPLHRVFGWTWVLLMAGVALSSFWIHDFRVIGPFSPIHLLSILTLFTLVSAVRAARRHDVKTHRKAMLSLVIFALAITGVFTLMPGRIMFQVVSGG